MAQTSTVHNFDITLSNVDRGVYESLKLQVARHPSETMLYLLTRVIAYCAEFQEGISFSKGLSDADEPAVWAHDLTGQITAWIEVGAPSAARLHKASKLGANVAVYTHKDPAFLISQLAREEIFQAERIRVYGFTPGFLEQASLLIEKRTSMVVSISEGQVYLTVSGRDFETELRLLPIEL